MTPINATESRIMRFEEMFLSAHKVLIYLIPLKEESELTF